MKNLDEKIADLKAQLARAKSKALAHRTVGEIREYEEWSDNWRDIDAQLYIFELMRRDAEAINGEAKAA